MAKFAKKLKDKYVEVPYGGGVAADDRTYYIDESGSPQSIEGKGLIAGKPYFFNNIFNILSSSPKVNHHDNDFFIQISSNYLIFLPIDLDHFMGSLLDSWSQTL